VKNRVLRRCILLSTFSTEHWYRYEVTRVLTSRWQFQMSLKIKFFFEPQKILPTWMVFISQEINRESYCLFLDVRKWGPCREINCLFRISKILLCTDKSISRSSVNRSLNSDGKCSITEKQIKEITLRGFLEKTSRPSRKIREEERNCKSDVRDKKKGNIEFCLRVKTIDFLESKFLPMVVQSIGDLVEHWIMCWLTFEVIFKIKHFEGCEGHSLRFQRIQISWEKLFIVILWTL
jgi:hypothetical protein